MSYFENSVTIVTGAASGIGREVAIQAAQRGSFVIATDINLAGLSETKRTIEQASGQVESIELDVSQADEILQFANLILPKLQNRKLILVNNAGVALVSGPFSDTQLVDFEWLLSINLWGVIRLTKAFLPYLLERNEGHIANVSSVFGLAGVIHQSAYCTAKFGIRGFTECLRMELMDTGVKTTVIHPGGIKTNIANDARRAGKITEEIYKASAKIFEKTSPTTAAEAANQILNAIQKGKPRLVIGNDGRMVDFITRLLPVGYTKFVRKKMIEAFGDFV